MDNTQNILSGKTWPGLFQAIKERISGGSLKRSQKVIFQCLQVESGRQPEWLELGDQGGNCILQHGEGLTLNFGESPNVERESILSMILEAETPDKYFLSAKACWGILQRAEKRQKEVPLILKIALLERIAEDWQKSQTAS